MEHLQVGYGFGINKVEVDGHVTPSKWKVHEWIESDPKEMMVKKCFKELKVTLYTNKVHVSFDGSIIKILKVKRA